MYETERQTDRDRQTESTGASAAELTQQNAEVSKQYTDFA